MMFVNSSGKDSGLRSVAKLWRPERAAQDVSTRPNHLGFAALLMLTCLERPLEQLVVVGHGLEGLERPAEVEHVTQDQGASQVEITIARHDEVRVLSLIHI